MRGRLLWLARVGEAAAVVAFGLFGVHAELSAASFTSPPAALAYALTVAAGAVLVLRRRFPASIAVTVFVVVLAYHLAGFPGLGLGGALFFAFYTTAAYGRGRWTLWLTGALIVAASAVPALPPHATPVSNGAVYGPALSLACLAFLGATVRRRRLDNEQRVRHERAAAEAALRQRMAEDRMLIARELHDVLAHTISAMTVQSGLALDALDDSPEVTRTALLTLRTSAREALAELRAALRTLRGEEPIEAATRPQPRLRQIDELTARAEAAGLTVHLSLSDVDSELPPVHELTAYRIVQEALTNTIRHSGAGTVWVTLRRTGTHLIVEVADDGRGLADGVRDGLGRRGMRERAEALGGTLHCGQRAGGGCRVLAEWPL